jgi:formate dehydrogenase accessory protein FdhE
MPRSTGSHLQDEAVTRRLAAVLGHAPELSEPAAFYRAALPLLHAAQAGVEPFELPAELAQRKLALGQPLLVGEDLPLDVAATHDLFLRLSRVVEKASALASAQPKPSIPIKSMLRRGQPDALRLIERAQSGDGAALRAAAARQIRQAVERQELDLTIVWQALAFGDGERVESASSALHLDTGLFWLLAQNSLKPAFRVWAKGLAGLAGLDGWRHGECPLCGSPPALAELQGKEGARRLRCVLCGADWSYPRLQCAFCGNHDYRLLGTISIEGEEGKYWVQTCEACRGYLKVVVTFDPTPVDLLPVEDLATLHLDLVATERGYARVRVQ